MIKAIIFDFFGVLEGGGRINTELLDYIEQELKPKYKLGIISNSSGGWLGSTLPDEEADLFDKVILSGRTGISKPHTEIFEHAAKKLGAELGECVFTDDNGVHCEGAKAAGMQAIHYQNFDQFKSDLEKLLN